jgi:hypothetical protein
MKDRSPQPGHVVIHIDRESEDIISVTIGITLGENSNVFLEKSNTEDTIIDADFSQQCWFTLSKEDAKKMARMLQEISDKEMEE